MHNVDYLKILFYLCRVKYFNYLLMDLQIRVFKNALDDKPVFRSTIVDVPDDMEYSILIKAFKYVFGVRSTVQFNII